MSPGMNAMGFLEKCSAECDMGRAPMGLHALGHLARMSRGYLNIVLLKVIQRSYSIIMDSYFYATQTLVTKRQ